MPLSFLITKDKMLIKSDTCVYGGKLNLCALYGYNLEQNANRILAQETNHDGVDFFVNTHRQRLVKKCTFDPSQTQPQNSISQFEHKSFLYESQLVIQFKL